MRPAINPKKLLASTLAASLIAAAPGLPAYAAVAGMARGASNAAAPTPAGVSGPALGTGPSAVSALAAPGSELPGLNAALPGLLGADVRLAVSPWETAPSAAARHPAASGIVALSGKKTLRVQAPQKRLSREMGSLLKERASISLTSEQADSMPAGGLRSFGAQIIDRLLGIRLQGAPSAAAALAPEASDLLGTRRLPSSRLQAPARRFAPENGVPALEGPAHDLKLPAAELEKVTEFTAEFHTKMAQTFKDYGFTKRDFYAWARFVRFFTPSLGVQEALRRGASYIYADRLYTPKERDDFNAMLKGAVDKLGLKDPRHGKDDKKAEELLKIAEPGAETVAPDEESPFHFPVAELIPDKSKVSLIATPTTLERIEAAYNAFALRDYMLMVGPPATVKSAIPKYLAGEFQIPHMAVTLHPGIGTFELVGGYKPKDVRIQSIGDAKRVVQRAMAEGEKSGDFGDILEAAEKVYGGQVMDKALKAVQTDLKHKALKKGEDDKDALSAAKEAGRRLLTLAHGIAYGSASLIWQDGYLTYAIKRDIWVTFEELNAAPTEVMEFLNEFMRSRRLVITEKMGDTEIVSPKKNGRFMLWATMNYETDSNREVLADTLKNRWRMKHFGPLPALEMAEILEEKFGMPQVWALALVENIHNELRRQAVQRLIGDEWRDGYEINLRHLFKIAKRWKFFVDKESGEKGAEIEKSRKLFLLGRESYSVYAGMMRKSSERTGVYTMIDQALKLSAAGVNAEDELRVRPKAIEDLGDRIRVGDVELEKGKGGPFVPQPNPDYMVDENILERVYEYAKAILMHEPLLLMGDTAAGKTSDLEYLFFRLDRNLRYRNLHSDSAIEEVVGGFTSGKKRGQFIFQEGMLPKAMEERTGAFLDEFNLNPLVEWLNTVVDDERLYLPHRIVDGWPQLVAAANPPEMRYEGRILLSPAVRSRWTEIWVPNDESKGRLKRMMGHWLKGGTVYSLLPLLALGLLWGPDSAVPLLLLGGLTTASGFSGRSFAGLWARLRGLFSKKKPLTAKTPT